VEFGKWQGTIWITRLKNGSVATNLGIEDHWTKTDWLIDWLTDWLTAWSEVLLEKLIVTHLVRNFPAFYGTQRFITVFTRAHHWSLFWSRWIQFTPYHLVLLRSILILSSHLHLSFLSCLFPSGFPT
jgi:hypothetical protein